MLSKTIFSLVVWIMTFGYAKSQYVWNQQASCIGGEIYDPFTFVIGSNAFIGTGKIIGLGMTNTVWKYDSQTDMWSQVADYPALNGVVGARGFAINNLGYAGTGLSNVTSNEFYKYDPLLNLWSPVSSLPSNSRYTATTFVLGGFGYLGLGYKLPGGNFYNDFWKYDPVNDNWSAIATFPGGARQAACSFEIGGFAYVGSGNATGVLYNDFYRYNPIINQWLQIANMPGNGTTAAFSFAVNNKGYVCLGVDYQNNTPDPVAFYNTVAEYDPASNIWNQLVNFPGGNRFHGTSFAIGSKGYIGLGSDTVYNIHYKDDLWSFSDTLTGVQLQEPHKLLLHTKYDASNRVINIYGVKQIKQIDVFDLRGNRITDWVGFSDVINIQIPKKSAGLLIVHAITSDNKQYSSKVLVY